MPIKLNKGGGDAAVLPNPDYTILIDKAEKRDMPWPTSIEWRINAWDAPVYLRLRYESVILPAGDFCIKGHEQACVVERKGSLNELTHNLFTDDYARFIRAIERLMQLSSHPVLFLDFPIAELHTPQATKSRSYTTSGGYRATTVPGLGTLVQSKLAAIVMTYGISVIGPLPSTTRAKTRAHVRDRRWSADWILRLMLAAAMKPIKRTGLPLENETGTPGLILPTALRRRNARATAATKKPIANLT